MQERAEVRTQDASAPMAADAHRPVLDGDGPEETDPDEGESEDLPDEAASFDADLEDEAEPSDEEVFFGEEPEGDESGGDLFDEIEEVVEKPVPVRQVDTSTLNRIFDGRLACRQLSDADLFDLRDWHKTLKSMLLQKGDRYLLAIQSLQIDIDKIDRLIDFRQARDPRLPPKPVAVQTSTKEECALGDDESEPQNEGQVIVLSKMPGWKNLGMAFEHQEMMKVEEQKAAAVVKANEDKETSLSRRLDDSYNGGASPYGYRGTFNG